MDWMDGMAGGYGLAVRMTGGAPMLLGNAGLPCWLHCLGVVCLLAGVHALASCVPA